MSKAPGSGVLARQPAKGFSSTKKRFLRLIFVSALWRDRADEQAINTPGFQPLSLYGAVIESLNYVGGGGVMLHWPVTRNNLQLSVCCQLSAENVPHSSRVLITHIKSFNGLQI